MEKKDIRDYLKYYLGCRCKYEHQEKKGLINIHEGVGMWKLIAIHQSEGMVNLEAKGCIEVVKMSKVTPILSRLEDITDEHKKELWQLVFKRSFPATGQIMWYKDKSLTADPRWVLMSGVERLGIEISGDVWADSDLNKWKFNPHLVTHYLLSKGYWLFGDSWFDEGLIIDKKTLK